MGVQKKVEIDFADSAFGSPGFIAQHELVELRRDDLVLASKNDRIRGLEIILKAKVLVQNVRVALFDRGGVVRRLSKRI